jgi:hypothetical protein
MRRFLFGLSILSIFLSGCGSMSVKINWNPESATPPAPGTPSPWATPDLTATAWSLALTQAATIATSVPSETPTAIGSVFPGAPAKVVPGAPLAFVNRDRIYWVNEAGDIRPLSDTAYPSSAPLVSPDKSLVAYLEARHGSMLNGWILKDIVLASTTRSFEPRSLVGDSSDELISFSPDGQWLLTRRAIYHIGDQGFTFGLQTINVLTGEDRHILDPVAVNGKTTIPYEPIWAPDSQHVFFDVMLYPSDNGRPGFKLYVLDIKTREFRILLDENQSGNLVFSPDGKRLLVAGINQLLLFDLQKVYDFSVNAAPQMLMSYELPQDGFLRYVLPQASWVENTDLVRLALPLNENGESLLTFWDISTSDAKSTRLAAYKDTRATQEVLYDIPEFPRNKMHVLWSPDMRRVALNINVKTSVMERSDILMADALGQNPVEFMHNARFVNWSPDGLHFIFISGLEDNVVNSREPFDLFVGRADDAGDSQVITSGLDAAVLLSSIRWLDDRTYIFQSLGAGSGELQLWRGVIGSPPTKLN